MQQAEEACVGRGRSVTAGYGGHLTEEHLSMVVADRTERTVDLSDQRCVQFKTPGPVLSNRTP